MSIDLVTPSNHLILCPPLLLLPSIFPSIRVFSNESALCMRWPKYGSFSFNISPSKEHPGLISFRMNWLDLLTVQGTLGSLLQHHSSKASILQHSAFFIVQLSHPYMTTGKITALTRQTFVDKVMSLLFNMLSRLVITFLLRSKHLLISWLQSLSAVILEPRKIKSATVSPSICHEVMGPDAMIRSLGQDDPLEKGMATHSSILAWRIPRMEEPGRLQSMGCKELDTTKLLTLFYTHTHTYIHMHTHKYVLSWWLSGEEPVCQCRRCRFDPWIRNIPWRRKWHPTPVLLPGESHGQRSLVGCSPWGCKRV